jgi:hypothetical protein
VPAPVFSLETTGTDPKVTTKAILETEMNRVIEDLWPITDDGVAEAVAVAQRMEVAEVNAVNAAIAAEASAEASGNVIFYNTKALADAALAGLSANQVVEVFADETRAGRRTRYRKESSVFVFKVYLDDRPSMPIMDQLRYLMTQQRVDFVGIGDSNQIFGGHGWDHGFPYALSALGFKMWATGLVTQNENNGSGAGSGFMYALGNPGGLTGVDSGAPASLDDYINKGAGGLSPCDYTYVTGSVGNNVNCGITLGANCPIDNGGALAFDIWWGSFATGSGSFRGSIRLDQSPFTSLATIAAVSTNTGVEGNMARATVSVTADPTRSDKLVGGKPIINGSVGITGPYFNTYYRFRNTDRSAGFAYGTLNFRGGQSTRTVAYDLQQASDDTLTHYFSILRTDQGSGAKTICIVINEGLNDRGETLASVGPGAVADGDSPEAYVDNHKAIVNRIYAIWDLNGWARNELVFLFMPSHTISDPDDAELRSYRDALEAYSFTVPRAQFVDLTRLTTSAEMLANGWYQSGGADKNHLVQAGYEKLSLRVFGAVA